MTEQLVSAGRTPHASLTLKSVWARVPVRLAAGHKDAP